MKRLIIVLTVIFAITAVGVVVARKGRSGQQEAVTLVPPEVKTLQEDKDYEEAVAALESGEPDKALSLIEKYQSPMMARSEWGRRWMRLLIDCYAAQEDVGRLVFIYQYFPRAFEDNEDASLLVGDALLNRRDGESFEQLRQSWAMRETLAESWLNLDADKLLMEGKREEALKLLRSKDFEGEKDVGRLVRLALLHVEEDPKLAWEHLEEAFREDPDSSEVRSFRGKLLETIGETELARAEYLAAVRGYPDSTHLRNQLAEFYRRQGQFHLALDVWKKSLDPLSGRIWVNAFFWNKMLKPESLPEKDLNEVYEVRRPLVKYLAALEAGEYWNRDKFEKLELAKEYLQDEQALFWLRLIDALKKGDEVEAANLLRYSTFRKSSWDRGLEKILGQILLYRKEGLLIARDDMEKGRWNEASERDKNRHQFFVQMDELAKTIRLDLPNQKLPSRFHQILTSDEVFSLAFLAAGWLEVALELNSMQVVPNSYPDWVAYGLTQAIRKNRSPLQALKFATRQKTSKPLSVLTAELMLSTGSPDAGLEQLQKHVEDDTDAGFRAAWLASLIYIDKGDLEKAKSVVSKHPKLSRHTLGKETLARIAVMQGDRVLADTLYSKLRHESAEAKSYLARKAFAEKDYEKAKELTMELLREFPNNLVIRASLKRIQEAENNE